MVAGGSVEMQVAVEVAFTLSSVAYMQDDESQGYNPTDPSSTHLSYWSSFAPISA